MSKVTKEEFCGGLPWTRDFRWFGLTGFTPMRDGRVAKVTFFGSSTRSTMVRVRIVDTHDGEIDCLAVHLKDYGLPPVVRLLGKGYKFKDEGDPDPTALCKAVEDYIRIFEQ